MNAKQCKKLRRHIANLGLKPSAAVMQYGVEIKQEPTAEIGKDGNPVMKAREVRYPLTFVHTKNSARAVYQGIKRGRLDTAIPQ